MPTPFPTRPSLFKRCGRRPKFGRRKLNKDKRRCEELDTIIKKLYESYAVGRIGEERFDTLLAGYEQEQTALRQSVTEAEAALDSFEQDTANVERFLALAKKYTDFSELTTPMINEFIDKPESVNFVTNCFPNTAYFRCLLLVL